MTHASRSESLNRARLYLLFTPQLCARDPWETLERALVGGTDLVQWRTVQGRMVQGRMVQGREDAGPTTPDPIDHDALERCLALCQRHGVPLIVNDDPALAAQVGADGAHVGQDDMPAAAARELLGDHRLLGISTHDSAQVVAATAAGADYLGFGPCFPTATKGYRAGIARPGVVATALAATSLPVFAIGGIDLAHLDLLIADGCRRIAVCSAILGAEDPEAAARLLRERLG